MSYTFELREEAVKELAYGRCYHRTIGQDLLDHRKEIFLFGGRVITPTTGRITKQMFRHSVLGIPYSILPSVYRL